MKVAEAAEAEDITAVISMIAVIGMIAIINMTTIITIKKDVEPVGKGCDVFFKSILARWF